MRFLITAGPTREPIDPVRYLSNRSSGKMGYAIAEAAIEAGHEVILISGPVNVDRPRGAAVVPISTSDEMFGAVHQHARGCDVLVMCAAVADYKPKQASKNKIKKRDENLSLELAPTRDILASLPTKDRQYVVVGFAAETENVEANARKKLQDKNCDVVVANDVSRTDSGMESDENEVIILFRSGEMKKISRAPKTIVARELVKIFANVCEKRLTKKNA
ncbi:MAG TPA: bifunctional phosphopantothenoylcysteine decarboxylase/phosphopantothenate--cysteine ligase CoaBC [Chthoniobacterales bacterium]|nr:bifunctional phosphopantothenoylcysteine decarboxylase/phosphopantothenate--cysteine ligase CoaBC [Chthoniobacterales bacterium]